MLRPLPLLALAALLHKATPLRQAMSLDGGEWQLTLDPQDAATVRMKANGSKVAGPVTVPGAWNAQGFGEGECASPPMRYAPPAAVPGARVPPLRPRVPRDWSCANSAV